MESFNENMQEYRKQLKKGAIKEAYRGLMDYFNSLRLYFETKYPDYFVSGSVYYGYMDMTYFSFTPKSLKSKKLKIAIVYLHEAFRFEVWLVGYNKKIQRKYWKLIKANNWEKYYLPPTTKGVDSIIECTLTDAPDFNKLDNLTKQIEIETLNFIEAVETFLAEN
ncbi:MAG: hypothetical protein NWF06_01090 [Candidatus Bathyarchaeota archaeon]|nr:hypothetical protein [Candidatus Bathyarchaeum sp.]